MIETDTRGIDALRGETDANVALLPARIWNEMIAELGDVPPVPEIDPFNDEPWLALPTMEQLEELWLVAPAVDIMVHRLALKLHGEGPDLPKFIATQRDLAEMELAWIREREAEDAAKHTADAGGSGGVATVVSAQAGGSGGGAAGGSEDGVQVGKVRKARRKKDDGAASPLHRG